MCNDEMFILGEIIIGNNNSVLLIAISPHY